MQEELFSEVSFKKEKKITWLSHTALEQLERCPRCFWLAYNKKIRQPQGIQSRLANRFDIVLKHYFNQYRQKGDLPPLIKDKLKGRLQNPFQERYYFRFNNRYGFYGKLDECLVNSRGEHIPVDFKTASSDPREKETLLTYQNQIDEYLFLLEENNKKTAGFGYLIYFYPQLTDSVINGFPMVVYITKIKRKNIDIKKKIEKAINVLEKSIPNSSSDCPYCLWLEKVKSYY